MASGLGGVEWAVDKAEQAKDPGRKLIILCLHGFRQNAKQFKGRLAGLQKKLNGVATFRFIDAPYVLPLWYKQQPQQQQHSSSPSSVYSSGSHTAGQQHLQQQLHQSRTSDDTAQPPEKPTALPSPKRAWLLSHELLAVQPQLQALYADNDSPTQHQQCPQHQQQQQRPQPQDEGATAAALSGCHLSSSPQRIRPTPDDGVQQVVLNSQLAHQDQHNQQQLLPLSVWQPAPEAIITADQHITQCCGWQQSWQVIQAALHNGEQVDGILGFSQGAAVAAVVAALLQQQECEECTHTSTGTQTSTKVAIKFVILASGFMSPAAEHLELLHKQAPISLPSLHVYAVGEGSSDRQIQQQLSEELMQLFDPQTRQQLVHDAGHLLPCNRAFVDGFKLFLQTFI